MLCVMIKVGGRLVGSVLMMFQLAESQSCLTIDSQWQHLIGIPVGLQLQVAYLSLGFDMKYVCCVYLACTTYIHRMVLT